MKILHIIVSTDPRGGGPIEGITSRADVWKANGHEFHILCLDGADAPWLRNVPVPVFPVGGSGKWYARMKRLIPWLRYGYSPEFVPWIHANIGDYDAAILNGIWNYASYGAWRALRKTDIPYFVFTHGMLDPWFNEAYPVKTFFKKIYWRVFEHRVLRDARAVFFTCEEERRLAAFSFSPYRANGIVVGYGSKDAPADTDAQREAFHARIPELEGRSYILFLSRIDEKKGIDLLIQGFAELAQEFPGVDLVIAGPDRNGLQPQLAELAQSLHISKRLHWPGMLAGAEKWGAFRQCEFFALASHQENFGVVISEALSVSKPVLITNKVNIWREIAEDGAGIVVDDNRHDVAEGLRRMLGMTREARAEMGRAGRRTFEKRYDTATHALGLVDILQRCISEPRKSEGI